MWSIIRLPDTLKRREIRDINTDEGNHIWLIINGLCALYSEQNGAKVLDYSQVAFESHYPFENDYDRFVTYRNGVWWFATRATVWCVTTA